jgi:2-polyprenyl-3-methyl-5-hydroxy-6-metoxy-1,4-benzoquinol methylase
MDDPSIGYNAFRDCLHDLALVNILSFGYRPTLDWLKKTIRRMKPSSPLSLIDVGCGGGDTLRQIALWSQRTHHSLDLTGVDLNPWSKQYTDQVIPASLHIKFETYNIFDFEPTRQADFIISSLFTHHLNDQQLIDFLQWMERHARHGWFINDLHRHPLAYYLFKYLSKLMRFDYMVQHDGAISVTRAFTKADWKRALVAASIPPEDVSISWFFPFRICIERRKR